MSPVSLLQQPDARASSTRWMLSVDGGGMFEVITLRSELVVGSPEAGSSDARLELVAPISRRQFSLGMRDGQFRITPLKPMSLNGQLLLDETVLSTHDALTCQPDVGWSFRQPSPLSLTGVLTLTSSHRWTSGADAIVFLDWLCLIGPDADCPLRVRHYDQRLVLFARHEKLYVKSMSDSLQQAQLLEVNQSLEVHGLRVRVTQDHSVGESGRKAGG